jgi:hypothetical protein
MTTFSFPRTSFSLSGSCLLFSGVLLSSLLGGLVAARSCRYGDVYNDDFAEYTIPQTCTSLSLSGNNIGDEGATEIAAALKGWKTALTTLSLSSNNIGDEGATKIADALKGNTVLTSLDLDDNTIGEKGAIAIAAALQVNTALTLLSLVRSEFGNNIGDVGATAIANALRFNAIQYNTVLTTLKLGDLAYSTQTAATVRRIEASLTRNKVAATKATEEVAAKVSAAAADLKGRATDSATLDLFQAVLTGNLAAATAALKAGADVTVKHSWTPTKGKRTFYQSAREIAHAQTPSWGRNSYSDIRDLIDTYIQAGQALIEAGHSKAQRDRIEALEEQKMVIEINSTGIEMLFYAVEVSPNCNLTLAEIAFAKDPSIPLTTKNDQGLNPREIALEKSGFTVYLRQNDCAKITALIDEHQTRQQAIVNPPYPPYPPSPPIALHQTLLYAIVPPPLTPRLLLSIRYHWMCCLYDGLE